MNDFYSRQNNRMANLQGYGPAETNQRQPKFTQYLTAEEKKKLQGTTEKISLTPTEESLARAKCFHRDTVKKIFTLVPVDNSMTHFRCTQCGAILPNLDDVSEETATKAFEEFRAQWEATKALDLDCAESVAERFYGLMPYLEAYPKLVGYVCNLYDSYYAGSAPVGVQQQDYPNGINGWQAWDMMTGNRSFNAPAYNNVVPGMQMPNQMQYPGYNYPNGMTGGPVSSIGQQAMMMTGDYQNPLSVNYGTPVSPQVSQMPPMMQPQSAVNSQQQQAVNQNPAPAPQQQTAPANNQSGNTPKTFSI